MPCKGRWRDSPLVLGCGGVTASRFYTSEVICVGRVAVRAFAYARASTEEQASAALGLDARIASTDGSIDERGWFVVGDVTDAGASGAVLPERCDALCPLLAALDAATPTHWWRLAWTRLTEARGPDWTSQIAASSTTGCWCRSRRISISPLMPASSPCRCSSQRRFGNRRLCLPQCSPGATTPVVVVIIGLPGMRARLLYGGVAVAHPKTWYSIQTRSSLQNPV